MHFLTEVVAYFTAIKRATPLSENVSSANDTNHQSIMLLKESFHKPSVYSLPCMKSLPFTSTQSSLPTGTPCLRLPVPHDFTLPSTPSIPMCNKVMLEA